MFEYVTAMTAPTFPNMSDTNVGVSFFCSASDICIALEEIDNFCEISQEVARDCVLYNVT